MKEKKYIHHICMVIIMSGFLSPHDGMNNGGKNNIARKQKESHHPQNISIYLANSSGINTYKKNE